jgi:hypothetical protein
MKENQQQEKIIRMISYHMIMEEVMGKASIINNKEIRIRMTKKIVQEDQKYPKIYRALMINLISM